MNCLRLYLVEIIWFDYDIQDIVPFFPTHSPYHVPRCLNESLSYSYWQVKELLYARERSSLGFHTELVFVQGPFTVSHLPYWFKYREAYKPQAKSRCFSVFTGRRELWGRRASTLVMHTVCGSLNFQSTSDCRFWFKVCLCTPNCMQSGIHRPSAAKVFTTMKLSHQTVLTSCQHSTHDGWTVPPHISQQLRILDVKVTCNYDVPTEHDLSRPPTHQQAQPNLRAI